MEKTTLEYPNRTYAQDLNLETPQSLGARNSALIAKITRRYSCEVQAIYNQKSVCAEEIMGLMTLEVEKGEEMKFIAEGEKKDCENCLGDLEKLFNSDFGENEIFN